MVIVACHGAQLAFVGIFCGFARTRLEWNQDLRNQQVAIRDTMLGAEPRNLLICPHVVSDQTVKLAAPRVAAHTVERALPAQIRFRWHHRPSQSQRDRLCLTGRPRFARKGWMLPAGTMVWFKRRV